RRDRPNALVREGARALDERGKQSLGAAPDDEVGAGAAHPVVAHGERERGRVAHVAGDAREPRVEHEDADGEAVLVLAATHAPGGHRPYSTPAAFFPDSQTVCSRREGDPQWKR